MKPIPRDPRRMIAAALALAAGAGVLVAADAGFDAVGDAFAHIRPAWLAVAFAAQVVAFAGYALAYRRIITALDGPRLDLATVARLVMTGFGAFAPGGGFVVDHRAIRALEDDGRAATVRVLALGALEYMVIAPAACLASAAMLVLGSGAEPSVLWPWAVAVPVGFAMGFWLAARRERIAAGRSGKRWRVLSDALAGIDLCRQMASRPLRFLPAFAGMAAYWAGEVLSLWAAVRSVDGALAAGPLIVGLATGYALTRRSLPLGGAGVTEALLSFALLWVGLDLATAVAAALIYRVLSFVLPMLPALRAKEDVLGLVEPEAAATAPRSGAAPQPAPASARSRQ
jgi:uncharacterized membrane protein YbhN (UPF0104 family)